MKPEPEKAMASAALIHPPENGQTEKEPSNKRALKAWTLLCTHTICCIALSMALVFGVNGYNAIGTSTPRYSGGKLRLRVSDITTLVSAALVIIKFFLTTWSAIALWRCAYILTHNGGASLGGPRISFMISYKLPPWIKYPFQKPKGWPSWAIAVVLLCILPQSFIAPLLSGAVNWNPSSVSSGTTIAVNSTWPSADFDRWYWYNRQGDFDKKERLRQAAGYAGLAWGNDAAVAANGSSMTGNGCRHVVHDGLLINSTLANATIPCIKIHNISWTKISDVPPAVSTLVDQSGPISLVAESPQSYYIPGVAVLFTPNFYHSDSQNTDTPPAPKLFSGTKNIGLNVNRQVDKLYPFGNITNPTGNVSLTESYLIEFWGNNFTIGNISLTAGVTTSAVSTYISSRVVEDQTPLDNVVFEPNAWVNEALWLLPDLMTMIAVMNSSQIPTWHNIDGYVENLVRQAYLAAWDMFQASFDMQAPVYTATLSESRIQATVSFARVFAWLAISLLVMLGGILLLALVRIPEDSDSEDYEAMKDLLDSLWDLGS
jgi:hypothetical protein